MRKLVTTLAVAATTAAAASAGPAPASAEAAGCTWKLPSRTLVYQGSNSFTLVKRDGVYTVDRRPLAEVTLDSAEGEPGAVHHHLGHRHRRGLQGHDRRRRVRRGHHVRPP